MEVSLFLSYYDRIFQIGLRETMKDYLEKSFSGLSFKSDIPENETKLLNRTPQSSAVESTKFHILFHFSAFYNE
jgi:hypothetical protein